MPDAASIMPDDRDTRMSNFGVTKRSLDVGMRKSGGSSQRKIPYLRSSSLLTLCDEAPARNFDAVCSSASTSIPVAPRSAILAQDSIKRHDKCKQRR